jgi:hypothetical protein
MQAFEWKITVIPLGGGCTVRPDLEPEPDNNDGREACYWCEAPTKQLALATSIGNVCTRCGK